jgi:antitoxin component YwqK of YwqJK toxin-antitoxin module
MKVNFDDIEIANIDAGGGAIYHYQNSPFTGTIVEYNNLGILVGELTIVNGSKKGRTVLFYDNGQIMEESFESYNRPYGLYRKWDENGNLLEEYDFGPEFQP